tara:strand:- start:665 stop:1345 length:681 start_codon:yes stop_codon:yes gene_type:complete
LSYLIVYNRPWWEYLPKILEKNIGEKFYAISDEAQLTETYIEKIKPNYIFFPHWSYLIPKNIYEKYDCVIFHMTDLPYGRGGSPLQNLIMRGLKRTKITAFKCVEKIDAGPVYLKETLSLEGNAQDIFVRSTKIIEKMIYHIINNNPKPIDQQGEVTKFKRRNPSQGNWEKSKSLDEIYNYIRMLDAEGYPRSFIKIGNFKLKFSNAKHHKNSIKSLVEIIEENNE